METIIFIITIIIIWNIIGIKLWYGDHNYPNYTVLYKTIIIIWNIIGIEILIWGAGGI